MIEITEVLEPFFGFGCNQPFLGRDGAGRKWVVKALPAGEMCHLVSDYIGARIGQWLGLPWVRPIELGFVAGSAKLHFEAHYERPIKRSDLCVLSGYHENLELITYGEEKPLAPCNSNGPFSKYSKEERIRIVRSHLRSYLNEKNLSCLCGRVVFDNWLAEKDPMMDMLQLDQSTGEFVCLDASTCLNDRRQTESFYENVCRHQRGEIHFMHQGLTLYAKALLTDSRGFEPWLARLQAFGLEDWEWASQGLPLEAMPTERIKSQTLSTDAFVAHFRERVVAAF